MKPNEIFEATVAFRRAINSLLPRAPDASIRVILDRDAFFRLESTFLRLAHEAGSTPVGMSPVDVGPARTTTTIGGVEHLVMSVHGVEYLTPALRFATGRNAAGEIVSVWR